MKKHELNGKSLKRAYRRHCAKKKLKLRAERYQGWYAHDFEDRTRIKSWGEIWKEIQEGKYGRWMDTTGTPCSCPSCSWPHFERKRKQDILKDAWKDIEDEAEDSTLVD